MSISHRFEKYRFMAGKVVDRLLTTASDFGLLPDPRTIYSRDGKVPYLSRYYLTGPKTEYDAQGQRIGGDEEGPLLQLVLHKFHRSDADPQMHNHPWRFAFSLILSGGYVEERREGSLANGYRVVQRMFAPGSVNTLGDSTYHRVDLCDEKAGAWTLILLGPKSGSWGFWDREEGWVMPWRDFIYGEKLAVDSARRLLKDTYGSPTPQELSSHSCNWTAARRLGFEDS